MLQERILRYTLEVKDHRGHRHGRKRIPAQRAVQKTVEGHEQRLGSNVREPLVLVGHV